MLEEVCACFAWEAEKVLEGQPNQSFSPSDFDELDISHVILARIFRRIKPLSRYGHIALESARIAEHAELAEL